MRLADSSTAMRTGRYLLVHLADCPQPAFAGRFGWWFSANSRASLQTPDLCRCALNIEVSASLCVFRRAFNYQRSASRNNPPIGSIGVHPLVRRQTDSAK